MKGIRFVVVVLVLAMIVVFVTGEAGQTRGPGGSDLVAAQAGMADTGEEGSAPPIVGSGRQVEVEPSAVESYNASIRISATALEPADSDVEWQHAPWPAVGCFYVKSGDQFTAWSTPLYLPDGATIRYFRMYYNDQSDSDNCEARLTALDAYGEIAYYWLIQSSGTGKTYVTTPEFEHVVDYDQYSYVIRWWPNMIGPDMQVCGFRVFYEDHWGLAYLPYLSNGD